MLFRSIPLPASLDVPTLTIALSAVYLGSLLFAVLLFMYRRTFPGAVHWIIGQALLALGALGVAVQSLGTPYATLAVSNVALLTSVVLFGHAIWKYRFGKGFPLWAYAVLPVSLAGWFAMSGSGIEFRIVMFSGALCILSGIVAAMLLVRRDDDYGPMFGIAAGFFIAVSATGFIRVVASVSGNATQSIAVTGAMSSLAYLLALFVAFFDLFGYFLLSSAKAERDLRIREKEIWRRNEELVETLETKDALIAVIGHDLRAPVSSASRYVRNHLVDFDGDLNTKRESIDTLAQGLERISGLLDSLLEWSLCASGRIKLQTETLRVREVLEEAAADLRSTAVAKGVSLVGPEDDGTIAADRRALATVFRNLMSNAVKYSRKGSNVRMDVSRATGYEGETSIIIPISDSGVGMKPDQIAKLFVPGRTLLTLGTNGEQGKGFGLAISKLFVEAMSGEIRVRSELGTGTRFEIIFPSARPR